jgi:hypothetical protein
LCEPICLLELCPRFFGNGRWLSAIWERQAEDLHTGHDDGFWRILQGCETESRGVEWGETQARLGQAWMLRMKEQKR